MFSAETLPEKFAVLPANSKVILALPALTIFDTLAVGTAINVFALTLFANTLAVACTLPLVVRFNPLTLAFELIVPLA